MRGFDRESLDSLREEYADNQSCYRNELTENIADVALEHGYDDETYYNSLYWFFSGSQTNAKHEVEANEFID